MAEIESPTLIAAGWSVYLSGEIHSDWRERIIEGAKAAGLDVAFSAPVTNHAASDACGVEILGREDKPFWADHKGAQINAIRTRTLIAKADIVVVRFGDKYKQWNAAPSTPATPAALGKPLIVNHAPGPHPCALRRLTQRRWRCARRQSRSSRRCATP